MDIDLYQEQLQEAARDPRWRGALPEPAQSMERHNASCGDRVQVWVSWSAHGDMAESIRWDGDGCLLSQAAASKLSAWAEGKTRTVILEADLSVVLSELGLNTIGPGRIRCVLLLLSTLQALAKRDTVASI